jgi:hypothetical protein
MSVISDDNVRKEMRIDRRKRRLTGWNDQLDYTTGWMGLRGVRAHISWSSSLRLLLHLLFRTVPRQARAWWITSKTVGPDYYSFVFVLFDGEVVRRWFDELFSASRRPVSGRLRGKSNETS